MTIFLFILAAICLVIAWVQFAAQYMRKLQAEVAVWNALHYMGLLSMEDLQSFADNIKHPWYARPFIRGVIIQKKEN